MKKPLNRAGIIAVFLVISIGNYTRINGTENIRAIEFISILTIGIFAGLLLREILTAIKQKVSDKDKPKIHP